MSKFRVLKEFKSFQEIPREFIGSDELFIHAYNLDGEPTLFDGDNYRTATSNVYYFKIRNINWPAINIDYSWNLNDPPIVNGTTFDSSFSQGWRLFHVTDKIVKKKLTVKDLLVEIGK